jgi:heme exporter protein D
MIWNSFSEFVQMGGYGLYVWGSYGVTLLLMTLEPWAAVRRRRQALQAVRVAAEPLP